MVEKELRKIIMTLDIIKDKQIPFSTTLHDLGFDIVDTIDLIVQLENHTGIKLKEEQLDCEFTDLESIVNVFDPPTNG